MCIHTYIYRRSKFMQDATDNMQIVVKVSYRQQVNHAIYCRSHISTFNGPRLSDIP